MSDRQTTAVSEPKTRAGAAYFFARLWKEKPLGTASGIIIVLFALTAIFADVLAPYGMLEMSLADRLSGPSVRFLLGTDHVGRDLLTRLIYGARVSLTVGLAATALNVVVALLIGGASGFVGGNVDLATQRFVDAWVSIPGLQGNRLNISGRVTGRRKSVCTEGASK